MQMPWYDKDVSHWESMRNRTNDHSKLRKSPTTEVLRDFRESSEARPKPLLVVAQSFEYGDFRLSPSSEVSCESSSN